MNQTLGFAIIILLIVVLLLILFLRPKSAIPTLSENAHAAEDTASKLHISIKDELRINREEILANATAARRELSESISRFKEEQSKLFTQLAESNKSALSEMNTTLETKLTALIEKSDINNKSNREELTKYITTFSETTAERLDKINDRAKEDNRIIREALIAAFKESRESFDQSIKAFNEVQREKFGQLDSKQNDLIQQTEKKLEGIRETVAEKLEKTLSERLGQSFDTVGKQLVEVQKGLGEMQTLAQDVGGLKKVLSNVKMRGGFGEVQLHMLLENILAPEQYEANVVTKKGGSERVEFAVKFPNKDGDRDFVWLPIDAKFPKDAYESLQTAYDGGEQLMIEAAQKNLEGAIRKAAKDICGKYIDTPNTTNFAIMFLPFEGLFAEVVRNASLLEQLQRDCSVVITGPTTLAVILNSLQMGFRTLAIQKRSGEVWQILGAVKKEFNEFGGILGKAQNSIQSGLNHLDKVVGVRTRAIQKQLKNVETFQSENSLPDIDSQNLLVEDEFSEEI